MTFIPPSVSKVLATVMDGLVYLTRGRITPLLGDRESWLILVLNS
jgi:hypothetical protein